jgi:leucyl-tRNA synthetase
VEGITRFLDRVWRLIVNEDGVLSPAVTEEPPQKEHLRLLHQTIKKVTEDLEDLRFNTAIAQMMVFTNEMTKLDRRPKALLESFVLLLAPFAPHISEELWERFGHVPSIAQQSWPTYDPDLVVSDRMTIPIQVNGKLRGKIEVDVGASRQKIEAAAWEQVQEWVLGKLLKKVIYVENKLINFVV